jgi:hypothetical protein
VAVDPLGDYFVRPLDRQFRQRPAHGVQRDAQVDERSEEHVAGDAAEGVNVEMSRHDAR